MTELVFFHEEPSAKAMLEGLIPRLLDNPRVQVRYIVFEGKQDLEKRLPLRLRAWQNPEARFLVMRDQDSGDCKEIKAKLLSICHSAGRPDAVVRIACHELESFYLGDLNAVAKAIGPSRLSGQQNNAKYRNPDRLNNASQELKRLAQSYQKISGSCAIGQTLSLEGNRSHSFNQLLDGIRKLTGAVE
ncbi:hypothetical protein Selin_0997 [Desulfurispirillum indicum S5]|uniref:DUF4276 family protein n=1 Tax=Desulfurispirillum indicum (strain ATCC BAA-1389 / DSM 22839 / S5) TaxID=653733 RepID=E6W371_DESIS|nr:DUF4276 family protein [Desulfurispirillum indicum]ADU65732.1 hypothetical protein Selin_0997 [Desulfurispirillum indicum S5]